MTPLPPVLDQVGLDRTSLDQTSVDQAGRSRQPDARVRAGPAARDPRPPVAGRGDGGRTVALAGLSLLLHVGGAVLAVAAIRPARLPDDPPPALAVVFEAPAPPSPDAAPASPPAPAEPSPAPAREQPEPPPAAAEAVPPPPDAAPEPPSIPSLAAPDATQPTPPAPAPRPPPTRPVVLPGPPRPTPPAPRPAPKVAARPPPAPSAAPPTAAVPAPAGVSSALPHLAPPAPSATPAPGVAAINRAWQGALAAWVQSRQRYPEAARRQSLEGQVALRVTISHDGQVL